jgi:hypothetical protein
MEVLADRAFRRAFASTVGGADEACQEFIRVPDQLPQGASPLKFAESMASHYDPHELGDVSLAPQVPPRRSREDGLLQPADPPRSNLAAALGLLSRWRLSKPLGETTPPGGLE